MGAAPEMELGATTGCLKSLVPFAAGRSMCQYGLWGFLLRHLSELQEQSPAPGLVTVRGIALQEESPNIGNEQEQLPNL